jgi:hypothetical protein
MMEHTTNRKTLWRIVGILIVGLIAGYSLSIFISPGVYGSTMECPLYCNGENCPLTQQ